MKSRLVTRFLVLFLVYAAALAAIAATPDRQANEPARGVPAVAGAVAADPEPAVARQVIAYYFHTTQRCATCRRIEQWSSAAIQAGFGADLADSTLVFLPINTDEKGNEHFIKDYALYTKSLVLVELKNGQPGKWKNLSQVWEYTGDQARFFSYVMDEVRAFLRPVG